MFDFRTVVAPQAQPISTFAINNAAQVAYTIQLADGGSVVNRWSQGVTETIAKEGDVYQGQPIGVPTRVAMNDSGAVAFSAVTDLGHPAGTRGVFIRSGPTLTKISPLDDRFAFTEHISLDNNGIAIFDTPATSYADIGRGDGLTEQVIFSGSSRHIVPQAAHANDAGAVVFAGVGNGGSEVVLLDGATTTLIASGSDFATPRYSAFTGTDINSDGRVLFAGTLFGELGGALFSFEHGVVTQLIDPLATDFFAVTGRPGLNDAGAIVFSAYLDNGKAGMFIGPDPVADVVLQSGDLFDGHILDNFGASGEINNAGQIAFAVRFTDGQYGLYLASPVPEPSSFVLAAFGLIGFAAWGWRRRR